MKIAICISSFSVGGVTTSTQILAKGLQEKGYQVKIFATSGLTDTADQFLLDNELQIEVICKEEQWLRRRLEITLDRLSEFDIIINNHSPETNLIWPALPAKIIRLSVIRSTNAPVITEAKACSPYLDALVAISPEVQRLMKAANVECRTEMIPNSVIIKSPDCPKLQTPLKLAYIGRLTDVDKNILIIPEIVQACKTIGLEFSFILAGDGKDRKKLVKKIQDLNLNSNIKLIGALSRDTIFDVMSKQNFAIFPSNYEGFGLALVESMGMGCVPIASDIPSHRWILEEEADTLLVPVKNAQAYAEQIRKIASNPNRYIEIQARLKKRQKDDFIPERTVSGFVQLINDLRIKHTNNRFESIPFQSLSFSKYHRRRLSRVWYFLGKTKLALRPLYNK